MLHRSICVERSLICGRTATLVVSEIVSNSSVSEHMALAVSKVVSYGNVSEKRQNGKCEV